MRKSYGVLGPVVFVALLLNFAVLPASAFAAQAPFGHACAARADGTRLCPTVDAGPGQTLDGVPSFDGVPLDVDVTLPANLHGP